MKYIYLDNNIIIDLKNKRSQEVIHAVDRLKNYGHRVVFSPAHMEEIANTVMHYGQSTESAYEKLDFIRNLTESYCLLPYPKPNLILVRNNGIGTYIENPRDTYDRTVLSFYKNKPVEDCRKYKLLEAEKNETAGFIRKVKANNSDIQTVLERNRENLSNNVNEKLFVLKMGRLGDFVPMELITTSKIHFSYICQYFPILEFVIENTMEYLEYQRYYPDKSEKSLASLHDTTHAIYGAYADIFVTNDANFSKKLKAVYEWLGVETKVFNRKEFVELDKI